MVYLLGYSVHFATYFAPVGFWRVRVFARVYNGSVGEIFVEVSQIPNTPSMIFDVESGVSSRRVALYYALFSFSDM